MKQKDNHSSKSSNSLTAKERLKALERVILDKVSVTDVCRAFNISRPTFYKWKQRYDAAGPTEEEKLTALFDQVPRKLRRSRQRIAPEIEKLIREIVVAHPQWGKRLRSKGDVVSDRVGPCHN